MTPNEAAEQARHEVAEDMVLAMQLYVALSVENQSELLGSAAHMLAGRKLEHWLHYNHARAGEWSADRWLAELAHDTEPHDDLISRVRDFSGEPSEVWERLLGGDVVGTLACCSERDTETGKQMLAAYDDLRSQWPHDLLPASKYQGINLDPEDFMIPGAVGPVVDTGALQQATEYACAQAFAGFVRQWRAAFFAGLLGKWVPENLAQGGK